MFSGPHFSPATDGSSFFHWKSCLRFCCVFLVSFILFFIFSNRNVGLIDETFPLVDAMRVMAGQVPHRDFYTPYGPAQYYVQAALFKLTYPSLFISRLLDLAYKAALVASVYQILSVWCRKILVYAGVVTAALLIIAVNADSSVLTPSALVILWSTYLINLLLTEHHDWKRSYSAGLLAGVVFLLRYDVGLALVMLHLLLLAYQCYLCKKKTNRWSWSIAAPYALGVLTFVLPVAFIFLAAGAKNGFIFDLVLYPTKRYPAGRALPFPHMMLREWGSIMVYVPFVIIGLAFVVLLLMWLRMLGSEPKPEIHRSSRVWTTCAVFVCLAAVMTLKGVVRTGIVHSFLGLIFAMVALCLLAESVLDRPGTMRLYVGFVCLLVVLLTLVTARQQIYIMRAQHSLMLQRFSAENASAENAWCADRNALTRGICYLPDRDHMEAIRYIEDHTKPQDRIFVGLPAHDKVFASDNLTYFASQRLPATHWSMFEPNLQNTAAIQEQMLAELEQTKPPLIVLDDEFRNVREPNDSAKSSGVHILDDYLHMHYKVTRVFGNLQIAERFS